MDGVGARNVTGDVTGDVTGKVARTMDMMLY